MWGGGGTEPLEERRATEEIQVERVGVIGQIDASGSVAVRQGVPVARATRQRAHVDEAQRVVPGHTLVDACVPRDENPKGDEQRERHDERQRRRAAGEGPDQERRGGEERRQPQPRDERRAAAPPARCPRRDGRRSPAYGTGGARHAACSMPAGFVPARFRRQ